MNRRKFVRNSAGAGAAGLAFAARPLIASGSRNLAWHQDPQSRLFTEVWADGKALVFPDGPGLLAASGHIAGETAAPGLLRITTTHGLRNSGAGQGEDLLEATLQVHNTSSRPQWVELEFATSARPDPDLQAQRVYAPVSAAGLFGDRRFAALGVTRFLKDCDQPIGPDGFSAHYLEPLASGGVERETPALLLAPVVDLFARARPWRIALFTPSEVPMRFGSQRGAWRVTRQVKLGAGETCSQRCWLLIHTGDASVAWKAFHRFAHREDFPVPGWARDFKVHYYDFLSSAQGENGRRGEGYESDLPHFRDFRVGMATQHGYYPAIGDFIQPGRKTWLAMRGDRHGPVEMSLEKMRARIKATRSAGSRAAIYMHAALFDDAAPCFTALRESVQVDANGQPMNFGWTGPDTAGKTWRASLGSPEWRKHLLQQASWIMELLQPDAIVMDETFAGLGYDHHPARPGATSTGAIDFYRQLRALVRSFGPDKAFFTSDCSMSPFVLWADGECGDHAYPGLLGHERYAQIPVRYLAALGDKPWRPCAWHFQHMWTKQTDFARLVGAGVGVSNGWLEYTGLSRLPADSRAKILADITALHPAPSTSAFAPS